MANHERNTIAASRLTDASAAKTTLLSDIAAADGCLSALDTQKKAESENDGELVALQQANASFAVRKGELVRATRSSRGDRDRLKDEACGKYYARLGAALELERALAAAALAPASEDDGIDGLGGDDDAVATGPSLSVPADNGGWSSPGATALLADAEALWKRVSTQASTTRDLLDASLARRRLALQPLVGSTAAAAAARASVGNADEASSSPPSASETAGAQPDAPGSDSPFDLAAPHVYRLMGLGRGAGQAPLPTPPKPASAAGRSASGSSSEPQQQRGEDGYGGGSDAEKAEDDEGGNQQHEEGGAEEDSESAAPDYEASSIAADAGKATEALSACVSEARSLQTAVTAACLECDAAPPSLSAVASLLALVEQNAAMQLALLAAVSDSVREAS